MRLHLAGEMFLLVWKPGSGTLPLRAWALPEPPHLLLCSRSLTRLRLVALGFLVFAV